MQKAVATTDVRHALSSNLGTSEDLTFLLASTSGASYAYGPENFRRRNPQVSQYFEYFEPLIQDLPIFPFKKAPSVAWEARRLLKGRSKDDVLEMASIVADTIEIYFETAEIRPIEEENIDGIDALRLSIDILYAMTEQEQYFKVSECLAVYGLMKLDDYVEIDRRKASCATQTRTAQPSLLAVDCSIMGGYLIEAVEAVALANLIEVARRIGEPPTERSNSPLTASGVAMWDALGGLEKQKRQAVARRLNERKHAKTATLRERILADYRVRIDDFDTMKEAAGHYFDRAHEFSDGESVVFETILRWISDFRKKLRAGAAPGK